MEFQEVMRQWTRICNAVPGKSDCVSICTDKKSGYICPMYKNGLCNKPVSSQTDDDRLEGEKIIMAWSAENPEPVYPTWYDWMAGLGLDPDDPIPADFAEKLGLKPK